MAKLIFSIILLVTLSKSVILRHEDIFMELTDEDFEAAKRMSDDDIRGNGFSLFYINQKLDFNLREGDILDAPVKEASITKKENFWPEGQIHYAIEQGYTEQEKQTILRAMEEYHQKTCIKFIPKTSDWTGQFIRITKGDGCFSYVGMVPKEQMPNGQQVTLASACLFGGIGSAVHELMHATGFEHEQSRLDRDDYVRILEENIQPQWLYAYDKADPQSGRKDLLDYDFTSIMHYHQGDFGKVDELGLPMDTMEPVDGDENIRFGNDQFSDLDVQKINLLYNCPNRR